MTTPNPPPPKTYSVETAIKEWVVGLFAPKKKPAPPSEGPAPVDHDEESKHHRVLVIRIGALGDIVLCFQAFHEIRQAHKNAEIAFLTMPAYADFGRHMPWFNRVIIDPRPPAWEIRQWLKLFKDVRGFDPTHVYDLQCKPRQSVLYARLGGPWGPVDWSGAAPFCSHPRLAAPLPGMHFTDYVQAQLQLADIPKQPPADVSWFDAPLTDLKLPERYAVLVPGCAPGREYKQWPARNFADLAQKLEEKGIASVAVGSRYDKPVVASIRSAFPRLNDFSGSTTLFQLAAIMRRAVCVIANDTGPMHIAAAVGAPTLGLMSERVNATWNAPKGPGAKVLQGKPLAELGVDKVLLALGDFLDQNTSS
jgi:ADP-heptose:LPS heptosyltransferase